MWTYNYTDELYHFGIKGMKWGVRRKRPARQQYKSDKKAALQKHQSALADLKKRGLQNDINAVIKVAAQYDSDRAAAKTNYKQAKKAYKQTDEYKVAKEKRRQDRKNNSRPHEDYTNAHSRKSVKSMSDKELRSRINRLNMEREYSEAKRKANKGQRAVQSYIKTAGTIAAFAGATATYKKYGKKYGPKILEACGNYVLNEVEKAFQY